MKMFTKNDEYAADFPKKKLINFYEKSTYRCVTPDFCDYSEERSFDGRFAQTCCEKDRDEVACCTVICWVPCACVQFL